MRLTLISALGLCAAVAGGGSVLAQMDAGHAEHAAAPAAATTAKAAIAGPNGLSGEATLTEAPKGVLLRVTVKGLTPGWHGLHFHAKGDCSAGDFTSAGGHVHAGADKAVHGLLNAEANDSGDLPNLYAAADGAATAELFSPLVSLSGAGGRPALLDADGSAIVIHANADDHKTQPIGGAGARVACGVVTAG